MGLPILLGLVGSPRFLLNTWMITPTTTNWVVPEKADLLAVISSKILNDADGNVVDGLISNQPIDQSKPFRSKVLLDLCVTEVRQAIRNAGHTPLSVYPGAVPPEAHLRVLYLAAWRLINSTPNLAMVIVTEKGV